MPDPITVLGIKLQALAPAFIGAFLVNLRRRKRPWWESAAAICGGTFGGTWIALALQAQFQLGEATFGAMSFLCGYVALAACDAAIDQLHAADLLATLGIKRRGDK